MLRKSLVWSLIAVAALSLAACVAVTPAAETPMAETPAAETPMVETPEAETPMAETPAAETPVVETPEAGVVQVTLTEYSIAIPTSSIAAGPTTFMITNAGTEEHSFEIEGGGIEAELDANLLPGETATLDVDLAPGTYRVYCPVSDHAEQGMELDLTVTE